MLPGWLKRSLRNRESGRDIFGISISNRTIRGIRRFLGGHADPVKEAEARDMETLRRQIMEHELALERGREWERRN